MNPTHKWWKKIFLVEKVAALTGYLLVGIICVFIFSDTVFYLFAQNDATNNEAPIYFNAATEKYIQGDIDAAVENVSKAIALEPDNRKYLDFASKILYEGALEAHNTRNYKRAYDMLEKALTYSPSDEKIQNLYKITREILSKKTPPESPAVSGGKESAPTPAPATIRRASSGNAGLPSVVKPVVIVKEPRIDYLMEEIKYLKKWNLRLMILCVVMVVVSCVMVIIVFFTSKKIRRLSTALKEKEAALDNLEKQNSSLLIESEKLRSALMYEKENSQRLARELKEEKSIKNEHFKEQLRMGLDIRQKQLEELMKSLTLVKTSPLASRIPAHSASSTQTIQPLSSDASAESEIYSGRARILEMIGDATYIDEDSSAALETARERIAAQAIELNKLSPVAAMNFLKDMASNPNPLIRANILKALSRLPSEWSVDMLLSLASSDPVASVRREAIREIKYIRDAVSRGEVVIEERILKKIKDFLKSIIEKGEWVF